MYDRVVLGRDLVDARGHVLAARGMVVSAASVNELARRTPVSARRALAETAIAEDLHLPLADPPYRHLFRGSGVQTAVARVLLAIRLPGPLFDELRALKLADPSRYRHALTTAAVTVRMLIAAVGEAKALPDMAAAGRGKVVFVLSSVTEGVPAVGLSSYVTVKHSLLGLMRSLAAEYAGKRINVNAVSPSMTETAFLSEVPERFVEIVSQQSPWRRNATPQDVAGAIHFLLSPEADYVTGVNLLVTGGSVF